ncbi:hypothetical protein FOA52_000220 [Chlamydomonas sp. UWO 241]|nr:hypothetical protein FOA52_000220 [Chlamydomonas sp. UWO 241]
MGMLTWGLTASGGGAHLLHTTVPVGEEARGEQAGGSPGDKKSRYRGVSWDKEKAAWAVKLRDPAKRRQYVRRYTSEEDAARAYDWAAVTLRGPECPERNFPSELITRAYDWAAVELRGPECLERNFPGELISVPPVSLGDVRRERKTSRFIGVCWSKSCIAWHAQLRKSHTKKPQHIGLYTCEEDAARAYDHALVELRGPECTERNFPGELISERLVSLGDVRRELKTSRFSGVSWNKRCGAWKAYVKNPRTKIQQHIGHYASEEDAARAYDYEAVKLHGPGYPRRNFPGEVSSEPPAARGRKR